MTVIKIGTLSGIDAFANAKGKPNRAMNPEIHSAVHKSAKDYNRKKGKVRVADFR